MPKTIWQSEKGSLPVLLLLAGAGIIGLLAVLSFAPVRNTLLSALFPKNSSFAATDPISNITTNLSTYPSNQVPKYEKLELTFDVTTTAKNLFFPYDANPPAGVAPSEGITVNAEFSQDNFVTKSIVPAFYYQDFDYQVKNNKDWIYPKEQFNWKVRFSPPASGNWQYRITKVDNGGSFTTPPSTFVAVNSANKGFIKVSKNDSRYFEYDDGSYFPAIGYNMNFDHISWDDPVQRNKANFQIMGQNGPLLIRHWLSQWGIWSSNVSPWRSQPRGSNYEGMQTGSQYVAPGETSSMGLQWSADPAVWAGNPCMSLGWMHETPAVKPNTNYKISIKYKIQDQLDGPAITGQPYGFVAKLGNWLTGSSVKLVSGTTWRTNMECAYPAALANQANPTNLQKIITPYASDASNGWVTLSGSFTTAATSNYLPNLYLATENIKGKVGGGDGSVFISSVEVREDLGNGQLGPNIISKSSADVLAYADQKYSYAFDKMLELAKQNNVYLKLVGLEKNESVQDTISWAGVGGAPFSNDNFYGNNRTMTKVRWMQQAWWRYMQARWGYSTNIQSWELLNEGDPFNGRHYYQSDEFAKYMHQFGNSHLVSTSMWNSFPTTAFWKNVSFPNIDYADVHMYMPQSTNATVRVDQTSAGESVTAYQPTDFSDTAEATNRISRLLGANGPFGVKKPIIRGETGFYDQANTDLPNTLMTAETSGKWLHKFLWGTLNPGGLIESYWYDREHLYPNGFDRRSFFGRLNNFVKDIPLNNGKYVDAVASVSVTGINTYGQKDSTNKRAHLWINNTSDTWKNKLDGITPTPISSAIVTIADMPAGSYPVAWSDPYTGLITKNEMVTVGTDGNLNLTVTNLNTDIAVKIGDYSISASPSPQASGSIPVKVGDIIMNGKVDLYDYNALLTDFGKKNDSVTKADLDDDNDVDLYDYNILLTNFGR